MRGKLVSSAALLIRLLPLVQLLLMRFLYFTVSVCAAKQGVLIGKKLHKAHEMEAGLAWVFAMAACRAGSMLDLHRPDKPGSPLPPLLCHCCRMRQPWWGCSGPAWQFGCCLPLLPFV